MNMLELQNFIKSELAQRRKLNPRFSLRRFAAQLEMSPSHLSLFLAGKKSISGKKLGLLSQKLQMSNQLVVTSLLRGASVNVTKPKRLLADKEFVLISDWYFFAILSLSRTHHRSADPRSIAKKLGISVGQAKNAIAYLKKTGVLSTAGGQLRQISDPIRTLSDVPQGEVQAYHRRMIQLAAEKIDRIPVSLREFGSITFALDKRKLKKIKDRIRDFQEEIAKIAETESSSEVYSLAFQFFPLLPVNISKRESQ